MQFSCGGNRILHELKKRDYEKVQPIFRKLEWNLITSAVIKGTSPGRIYVDRVQDPRTAFMCTVEGYYLAGFDSNDEFNTSLNKLIFERIFAGDTIRKDETDVARARISRLKSRDFGISSLIALAATKKKTGIHL